MAYTDSQTERKSNRRQWQRPRLIELHYPATIRDIRDRDNWIKAMILDRRLKERTRLILSRLALHLNLKTGRCDPSAGLLGTEVALPGSGDVVERMVRRALAEAARVGWIRRTFRHGGDAKRQSQTNSYALAIPDDATTGLWSPVVRGDDRTNCHERPDSRVPDDRTLQSETTGLQSPANSEENSEINHEGRTVNLRTMDSCKRASEREFDEGKVKEASQASEGKSSLPASTPTPPNSACSPSPQPKPESGLAAALERFEIGVRGGNGVDRRLTVSSSEDVARARLWRQ
jgi:hypothetical protein